MVFTLIACLHIWNIPVVIPSEDVAFVAEARLLFRGAWSVYAALIAVLHLGNFLVGIPSTGNNNFQRDILYNAWLISLKNTPYQKSYL